MVARVSVCSWNDYRRQSAARTRTVPARDRVDCSTSGVCSRIECGEEGQVRSMGFLFPDRVRDCVNG